MTHHARPRYAFLAASPPSAFSRPRREHPDGSYEIHLVKSQDPAYIPADLEAWPIYYRAIIDSLLPFREAHAAAVQALRDTRVKLAGYENRDAPPGSQPPY